jgi:hypothetical protein
VRCCRRSLWRGVGGRLQRGRTAGPRARAVHQERRVPPCESPGRCGSRAVIVPRLFPVGQCDRAAAIGVKAFVCCALVRPRARTRAGTRITAVAAGQQHSLALSQDGRVFAWGSGHYGSLGLGTRECVGRALRRELVPSATGTCPAAAALDACPAAAARDACPAAAALDACPAAAALDACPAAATLDACRAAAALPPARMRSQGTCGGSRCRCS